jgi:hypothetical protein
LRLGGGYSRVCRPFAKISFSSEFDGFGIGQPN